MSTLFHIADVHFGREDRAAVDAFAAAVRERRPDAVLMTGDLTTQARAHEFAAAADWLAELGVPLSIEVGNHDLPYFNPWNRLVRPYARIERLEAALDRPIVLPDVTIVPLRTTARMQLRLNWAHGNVTPRRVRIAAAALNAVPDGRVRIVACHHPLYDRPGGAAEGRTRGGRDALFALADARCDLVVSGHVHDPFDIVWTDGSRPVRMIGAGTLSERTRATPPSFNHIAIDRGKVVVTSEQLR